MHKISNKKLQLWLSITALLFASINCYARDIAHAQSLSDINSLKDNTEVTAPYYILSDTKYTTELHSFTYADRKLKILNNENPNKIRLKITQHAQPKPQQINDIKNVKLPWWSRKAPQILQTLDFSKVDGTASEYQIGDDYRLTLLGRQGHWGRVYVLEHIVKGSDPKIICAVKVLLTRPEYNKPIEGFRARHKQEIFNNVQLAKLNLAIAIEPFGVVENDPDHYLLFTEYGENAHEKFKQQSLDASIDILSELLNAIDKLHMAGLAHGDLKIDNMLFVNNKIKLCDWYSLDAFTNNSVGKYRYIGDNLPPEAMRAFYFKENNELKYSQLSYNGKLQTYILHPITADRYCVAISMLEILAPDLYMGFEKLSPKGFSPYAPESLDFWQANADYINIMQDELLLRAKNTDNIKQRQLFKKIVQYINLDPLSRI
jgi:hypothetical protein